MDTMIVIKIPLMVEAFRQIEAGKFTLADRIALRNQDKRPIPHKRAISCHISVTTSISSRARGAKSS